MNWDRKLFFSPPCTDIIRITLDTFLPLKQKWGRNFMIFMYKANNVGGRI